MARRNSSRRGEEWTPGMRVQVNDWHHIPRQRRVAVIIGRKPGRVQGERIYWFEVVMDGIAGTWRFGPDDILPTE